MADTGLYAAAPFRLGCFLLGFAGAELPVGFPICALLQEDIRVNKGDLLHIHLA